jgi:arylsulfatase A-like enzyme
LLLLLCSPLLATDQPNIVLIFADDLGYGDVGGYGADKVKTPHLDTMAKEGLRLTSFYAQAVCGPSQAALMTGCYPIRVAEPGNRKNPHTVLHPKEITIAEVLRDVGYATACIGKWHLGAPAKASPTGFDPATMPNGQGFDEFFGTPLYNGFTVEVADTKFRSTILRNDTVVVPAVESWDHITQNYTREAIAFIQKNREHPFFLYLAHNMPHIPLGASERFKGKSASGPYGDAVEEIDWSAARS